MQQTIFKPVSIPCTSFYLIILSGRMQKSIRGEAADGCSSGVLAWECRGTVGAGLCGEDRERDCRGGTGMDRGIFGEGGDSPWNWIKQKKTPRFCSEGFPFVKSKIKCLFWVFYCRNGKYFYRLKRLKTLKYKDNHAITRIAWLSGGFNSDISLFDVENCWCWKLRLYKFWNISQPSYNLISRITAVKQFHCHSGNS